MPITKSVNSKANVKQFTNNDVPFNGASPVIASSYTTSTIGQTVINLPFSIVASGSSANTDIFWLFINGIKLDLGSSNDYTFTSILSDGTSAQVTLTTSITAGLNIQAFKLGYKLESQFLMDNRFIQLYAAEGAGFQGFIDTTTNLITATSTVGTPAAGTFYSTIVGRASLPDLSQDLKARMGVERHMTQPIAQIQGEFGPNGEPVLSTPNDIFGQIRFIGSGWATNIDSSGARAQTSLADSLEITFYGTGLNVLTYIDGTSRTFTVTTDGNSSPTITLQGSSVLSGRNYGENAVINFVSGLSLGIHTIKITANSNPQFLVFGFEILNESSNVKVNSGIGYIQGQKLVNSSQNSFAYSAPVTGTKGGRVLVYQKSDGTIATSFNPTNASQLNLAAADHTNEEMVRKHSFREFSAGRSDDFGPSFINTSPLSAVFTLDDGTTTLIGNNVSVSGITAYPDVLQFNTTNSFASITFVGTGLDIERFDFASVIDPHSVTVDGIGVGNITSIGTANVLRQQKIVSGLPYGTHVVKILRTNNAQTSTAILRFNVYQPKKPSLPSGAIELGDYNAMATFVANSTQDANRISTGVLRKNSSREVAPVGTSWSIAQQSLSAGGYLQTTSNTDYVEYTFFGTGFDLRFSGFPASDPGATLTVDGASNLSGFTTSFYGGASFTPSTGVFSQVNNSGNYGCGLIVSNISLGVHKLRVTKNGGSFITIDAIDIITPIHSVKSNIYADLQNSLPVGSQAISDNRKFTPVKDLLPAAKAWGQAVGITAGPSTSSTTPVPMPDMSLTLKTTGTSIKCTFLTEVSGGSSSHNYVLMIDGVQQSPISVISPYSGNFQAVVHNVLTVSPGTHKYDIFWYVGGGTVTAESTNRQLIIEEK